MGCLNSKEAEDSFEAEHQPTVTAQNAMHSTLPPHHPHNPASMPNNFANNGAIANQQHYSYQMSQGHAAEPSTSGVSGQQAHRPNYGYHHGAQNSHTYSMRQSVAMPSQMAPHMPHQYGSHHAYHQKQQMGMAKSMPDGGPNMGNQYASYHAGMSPQQPQPQPHQLQQPNNVVPMKQHKGSYSHTASTQYTNHMNSNHGGYVGGGTPIQQRIHANMAGAGNSRHKASWSGTLTPTAITQMTPIAQIHPQHNNQSPFPHTHPSQHQQPQVHNSPVPHAAPSMMNQYQSWPASQQPAEAQRLMHELPPPPQQPVQKTGNKPTHTANQWSEDSLDQMQHRFLAEELNAEEDQLSMQRKKGDFMTTAGGPQLSIIADQAPIAHQDDDEDSDHSLYRKQHEYLQDEVNQKENQNHGYETPR